MTELVDFKRPTHNDFATAKELRERNFSGIRNNSLNDSFEIWLDGDLKASVSQEALAINPRAIEEAYSTVFMLDRVMPDHEEARKLGAIKDEVDNLKLEAPIIINTTK